MIGLFDMSEADLDRAVEAHYNRLYYEFYESDAPEACCGNCKYYDGEICELRESRLTEEEISGMEETDDFSDIERKADEYCFEWKADGE